VERVDMGGLLSRLCCCKKGGNSGRDYKKVESQSLDDKDIEAGGDDDDDWGDQDDWEPGAAAAKSGPAAGSTAMETAEPEAEPEPDPFAEFGMAPKISATKRHAAVSAWERPKGAVGGRFAMSNLAPEMDDGDQDGWIVDDGLDGLSAVEKRRAAEQKREARRRERDAQATTNGAAAGKTSGRQKLAATKVSE
jgi:hypothetical protein